MKYSKLGRTGLDVSRVCLGTMTWGEQNSQEQAFEQMDYAVSRGVNFFDTAEVYAVPTSAGTQGKTEEIIGNWFEKTGKRQDIILATKVVGVGVPWIRDAAPLTGASVRAAVDGSLKRLKTDYIDLYQLHWTNRGFRPESGQTYAGQIDFSAYKTSEIEDNLLDILQALGEAVKAGKVRHTGLSDDSAWGIMKYLELAQKHNLPRMQSIQNEFSLLCRTDDPYLVEPCVREDVSYLPWSPLAAGILSGKYQGGALPTGARYEVSINKLGQNPNFRLKPSTYAAVDAYMNVAQKHDLDICQMALKFVDVQNFVTSTIIGATSMDQLKTNIDAFDINLSADVLADIDAVYKAHPLPF